MLVAVLCGLALVAALYGLYDVIKADRAFEKELRDGRTTLRRVQTISSGPGKRDLGEILRDPPRLELRPSKPSKPSSSSAGGRTRRRGRTSPPSSSGRR